MVLLSISGLFTLNIKAATGFIIINKHASNSNYKKRTRFELFFSIYQFEQSLLLVYHQHAISHFILYETIQHMFLFNDLKHDKQVL